MLTNLDRVVWFPVDSLKTVNMALTERVTPSKDAPQARLLEIGPAILLLGKINPNDGSVSFRQFCIAKMYEA